MKKIFNFCMIALVAMCGLQSCSEDCDHNYIEHDYTNDLVGTWTCIEPENDYAEALVIKADGSVEVTGMVNGEFFESKGTIRVKDNQMTYVLENGDEWEGRFEMVAGEVFSLVDDYLDVRYNYHYCANDLSDEILGMWVCNDTPAEGESEMMIETFYDNGKTTLTGFLPLEGDSEQVLNESTDYKVVGDLLFITIPAEKVGGEHPFGVIQRLAYSTNETLGDMITMTAYAIIDNQVFEGTSSWLRVKQNLDLSGKKYDYSKTFVSNVKGLDLDYDFMGYNFNFAEMDGIKLDKILKHLLFTVEFPDANTIKYNCYFNGQHMSMEAPIALDGNKMTVKMKEKNDACRNIDLYVFQDQDNSQMHMYMSTSAFINFFGNMRVTTMSQSGQLDINDADAVKAVFERVDKVVESINVSFVMEAGK